MKLPVAGQEYAKWKITSTHEIETFEVQFDGDNTWYPLSPVEGRYRILVCGPDKSPSDNAVHLRSPGMGRKVYCRVRAVDTPELVIRNAGWIELITGGVD